VASAGTRALAFAAIFCARVTGDMHRDRYLGANDTPMKSNRSIPSARTIPVLTVADVRAAVAWLGEAFGFAERLRIGDGHRSQLELPEEGALILAEVGGNTRVPTPGSAAHSVMVRVADARAHFERSQRAGARILMEPTDFEYGERQYAAEDPFGHRWTFSETLADVDPAEWLEP
jgi:uncharacterized glyoxalase superfamily protein PhnB